MSITKASLIDLNGQELILDADADTSITADTDDRIDIKVAGSDIVHITSSGLAVGETDTSNYLSPDLVVVAQAQNGGITVKSSNTSHAGTLAFADATSGTATYDGYIQYEHNNRALTFAAAGGEGIRLSGTTELIVNDGSGDLDFRIESNGQANMFFIDGADDAVVIGHNASRKTLFNTTATAAFQIEGTSASTAAMSIVRNSNDDNGPQLIIGKSNGTSAGAVTVVTDDALLGRISFQGADGTQTVEGARIQAFVDGTPGADDMPGRLTFSTTADGGTTPTERMRIDSSGKLLLGKTTTSFNTAGSRFDGTNIQVTSDGATTAFLQRLTDSGNVIEFYRATSFVGAIGVDSAGLNINEGSNNQDFRVESDGNSNALLVDAGNNFVGVGSNAQLGAISGGLPLNAGIFRTFADTIGASHNTATTMVGLPSDFATYIACAGFVGVGNTAAYGASAIIHADGTSYTLTHLANPSGMTLSMSGSNVQATQTSGSTLNITFSIIRIQ